MTDALSRLHQVCRDCVKGDDADTLGQVKPLIGPTGLIQPNGGCFLFMIQMFRDRRASGNGR